MPLLITCGLGPNGGPAPVVAQSFELVIEEPNDIALVNTTERISIVVENTAGTIVNPYSIALTVMDLGSNVILTDSWPSGTGRIVQDGTGLFHVDYGQVAAETANPSEVIFRWQVQLTSTSGYTTAIQKLKVISVKTIAFLPEFKILIDKARKLIDPTNNCMLGYTNGALLSYLEGGLTTINAYQPTLSLTLDNYPLEYKQILLDAGLITGATSQQLFAIDTDIPNYNDNGTTFTIAHQPMLASFLNQITQRLDKMIPMMKLALINPGTVHTQMGPNFRLNTIISAAPTGSLFRNIYFSG